MGLAHCEAPFSAAEGRFISLPDHPGAKQAVNFLGRIADLAQNFAGMLAEAGRAETLSTPS